MRPHFHLVFLVSMSLLPDAFAGSGRDGPSTYIAGTASEAETLIVGNTIHRILTIASDPPSLREALTPDLQLSECFKLHNGASRCIYADPSRGEGRPVPLVDLDLISLHAPADLGGTAFWDVREGICISPHAFDGLGVPQVERGFLPGEPFTAGETVELTEFAFQDVNPRWGRVDVRLRVRHDCVGSVQLRMARSTN